MEPNTLYYAFSTMAQVIAAIVAILAAFTHFRLQSLRDLLVGHGKSVLNRWGTTGYTLPGTGEDQRQKDRLRDAIDRRSIPEIRQVISLLPDAERAEGHTKTDRPGGLQNLYEDRFSQTDDLINRLRGLTMLVVSASFLTILASIVCIAFTQQLILPQRQWMGFVVLGSNVTMLVFVLSSAWRLVRLGLSDDPVK